MDTIVSGCRSPVHSKTQDARCIRDWVCSSVRFGGRSD